MANFKFPTVPIATFGELMLNDDKEKSGLDVPAPDRNAVLFRLIPISCEGPSEEENLPDEFFELTANEAWKLQNYLTQQARELNQQALLPRSYVNDRNKARKLDAYCHSVIRLRLSESVFIQCLFLSAEPVSRVLDFMRGCVKSTAPQYNLSLGVGEKLDVATNKDLIDAGLAPKATIFVSFKGASFSEDFLDKSHVRECNAEEAAQISDQWVSANTQFVPEKFIVDAEPDTQLKKRTREENSDNQSRPSNSKSPSTGPKPKWFKPL